MMPVYPGEQWEATAPTAAGFDPDKLAAVHAWLEDRASAADRFRIVVVRHGRVVAEWNRGLGRDDRQRLASATKSLFSCILGILVDEGKLPSADVRLVDVYPEALDVVEGAGPKPGRYAYPKDRAITLRQLISNTSGYMKPGEEPGAVFNYQTYGMNVLTHALARLYGLYDVNDPQGSPGLAPLIQEKLAAPIGATWGYYVANFDLPSTAAANVFGYYDGVQASALDMARLGWLWCNWGRWRDSQVVPEAWLRAATATAPDILAHCPPEQWAYGYGFWTNEHGRLWPHLPRDSFAASGAGSQHIWVCPSLELVVVQSPGLFQEQAEHDAGLLRLVTAALATEDGSRG